MTDDSKGSEGAESAPDAPDTPEPRSDLPNEPSPLIVKTSDFGEERAEWGINLENG